MQAGADETGQACNLCRGLRQSGKEALQLAGPWAGKHASHRRRAILVQLASQGMRERACLRPSRSTTASHPLEVRCSLCCQRLQLSAGAGDAKPWAVAVADLTTAAGNAEL